MRSTLGRRVFLAHLELSYQLGRRVTLAEFGRLVAQRLRRGTPFAATAVSKWEAGLQSPGPDVIEAIAELTGVDPGWISHGAKSAAPGPRPSATKSPAAVSRAARPRKAQSAPAGERVNERPRPRSTKRKRRGT